MTIALLALAVVAALLLAAFCAGAETGIFSLNRGRIVHMAREGSKAAIIIERALQEASRTLTGLLVGNNLGSVVFSSASAALAEKLFPGSLAARTAWSFCAACTMLALGEFTPKLLCATRPLGRMLGLAQLYRVYAIVFAPFTLAAMLVTGRASEKKGKVKVSPDDLLSLLSDRKNGVRITDFESALIARILVLRKKGEAVTADNLLSALDEPGEEDGD